MVQLCSIYTNFSVFISPPSEGNITVRVRHIPFLFLTILMMIIGVIVLLKRSEEEENEKGNGKGILIALAVLLVSAIACLYTFLADYTDFCFNGNTRQLVIHRHFLKGKNGLQTTTIPFLQVSQVVLSKNRSTKGATYRVVLLTLGDDNVPLTKTYSSGLGQHKRLAEKIRDILGLDNPIATV